ncbi:MAG: DUF4174 domain-containing protein [Bacteroidota bacterium]
MRFTFIFFVVMSLSFSLSGQNLSQYQWENRLLVCLLAEGSEEMLHIQEEKLSACEAGLKDRQLLLQKVYPQQTLYRKLHRADAFEILLIGLDGGVKARWSEPIDCEEVFALIDGMPMRRAELRRRNTRN